MAMKRRRLLLIGAVALGCGALPQAAGADPCPAAPVPGPTWFEFSDGSVQFRQEVFARPGLNLATTGVAVGQALRAGQAATGFWKMGLQDLVGTITAACETRVHHSSLPWIAKMPESAGLPGTSRYVLARPASVDRSSATFSR